jgi:hypothetical protein
MNVYRNKIKSLKKKKDIVKIIKRQIHYHALGKMGIRINIYKNTGNEWIDIFNNMKADKLDIIEFLSKREAFGDYQHEEYRFTNDINTFTYTIVVIFPIKINNVITELTASCILQKATYPDLKFGNVWWLHEVAKFPLDTKPSLIPIMMTIAEEIIKQKSDKLYLLVKYPKNDLSEKSYQQKMDDFNWLSKRYNSVYNYKVLNKYKKIQLYNNVYMVMYKQLKTKRFKKTLKVNTI